MRRSKAFIPVQVPPVRPAGVLSDPIPSPPMRFGLVAQTIRPGARVRVWGGYEMEPRWLPEYGARNGVLGTVVRFLNIPRSIGKEAVIKLDRPLVIQNVSGEFIVLRLRDPLAHWTSGETVSVELCNFEPNTRFIKRRDTGILVEIGAICELL